MDLAKRIKDQLSSVQKALATARTGVASIRTMISELQRERERVRTQPVPRDEAVAAIDQMLQAARAGGSRRRNMSPTSARSSASRHMARRPSCSTRTPSPPARCSG